MVPVSIVLKLETESSCGITRVSASVLVWPELSNEGASEDMMDLILLDWCSSFNFLIRFTALLWSAPLLSMQIMFVSVHHKETWKCSVLPLYSIIVSIVSKSASKTIHQTVINLFVDETTFLVWKHFIWIVPFADYYISISIFVCYYVYIFTHNCLTLYVQV